MKYFELEFIRIKYCSFIFMLICLTITGQNLNHGIITYNARMSEEIDTSNVASEFKKHKNYELIKKATKQILESATDISYTLEFNESQSKFYRKLAVDIEDGSHINLTKILGGTGEYFTFLEGERTVRTTDFFGEQFLVTMPNQEWKLTNEVKNFGKFRAFKAESYKAVKSTNGMIKKWKIIAWYVPEISAFFGPKGYWGLPGLIVEIHEGKLILQATKIELNPNKEIKFKNLKKGKEISFEEFDMYARSISKKIRKGI